MSSSPPALPLPSPASDLLSDFTPPSQSDLQDSLPPLSEPCETELPPSSPPSMPTTAPNSLSKCLSPEISSPDKPDMPTSSDSKSRNDSNCANSKLSDPTYMLKVNLPANCI